MLLSGVGSSIKLLALVAVTIWFKPIVKEKRFNIVLIEKPTRSLHISSLSTHFSLYMKICDILHFLAVKINQIMFHNKLRFGLTGFDVNCKDI